ncbi:hypothetical protein [uncultured Pseudoteredinibacter sp.]|uniref:hypothetical protein n=1 Tax=uncultured Pseudoteredinibacter sp. TaxID=1641701 RepID=UPI0026117733|nr:hypothetical protein [uncultured Pseudoteredinibacter sp.]
MDAAFGTENHSPNPESGQSSPQSKFKTPSLIMRDQAKVQPTTNYNKGSFAQLHQLIESDEFINIGILINTADKK